MARVGIIGGTGPQGLGIGLRFALAGETVVIGSRDPARAEAAAQRIRDRPEPALPPDRVAAADNATAARTADVAVLSVPFAALPPLLPHLAGCLDGKIVLDVTNPLIAADGFFDVLAPPEGSASAWLQARLPGARLAGCFKTLSAPELWRLDRALEGDVLVCSDHTDATRYVADVVARIPRLRAVDAGPLAAARHVEHLTALLLTINRRHRARTAVRIVGLPPPRPPAA